MCSVVALVGGGVNIGLDIRIESTLVFGCNGLDGGESGLRTDEGTGCWNHAKSGLVLRTSLSICSNMSLSWKNVLHFEVVAELSGYY